LATIDAFLQLFEVAVKGGPLQREIGTTAGLIWDALNAKGELSLAQLEKAAGRETPVFEWAIGWLAREDKIVIIREGRTFRVGLKGTEAKAARAK
jgi:HSP20 family protein